MGRRVVSYAGARFSVGLCPKGEELWHEWMAALATHNRELIRGAQEAYFIHRNGVTGPQPEPRPWAIDYGRVLAKIDQGEVGSGGRRYVPPCPRCSAERGR